MKRQPATVLIIFVFLSLLSQPSFRVSAEQTTADQATTRTIAMAGVRDDLLTAALAVFDQDGFEGATVAAIRFISSPSLTRHRNWKLSN